MFVCWLLGVARFHGGYDVSMLCLFCNIEGADGDSLWKSPKGHSLLPLRAAESAPLRASRGLLSLSKDLQ